MKPPTPLARVSHADRFGAPSRALQLTVLSMSQVKFPIRLTTEAFGASASPSPDKVNMVVLFFPLAWFEGGNV